MPAARRVVPFLAALLAISTLACDRPRPGAGGDSATGEPSVDSSAISPDDMLASGWNTDAGPVVILPTEDGGLLSGSLLRPEATELTVGDTTGLGAALVSDTVELFARSGKVGVARLRIEKPAPMDSGCTAWPVARLAVNGGTGSIAWTAAFAAGRVTAIPLDSIEGLSPRDSSTLVRELTRLASGVPDTTTTFRGLPFVVLRAWRTRGIDTGFVVATLARRINQEDSPQEERLVMVVNQLGSDPKTWVVKWHERASGREEELVVAEPLLAFRAGRSRDVHLLFGRDDGVALGAAVLTRDASGWHVQWESAVAGCD